MSPTIAPILVEMKESIGWMIKPEQAEYMKISHLEELYLIHVLLQKGEFTATTQSLNSTSELINKIMLWCDCSGEFTSDELRGDHEFIECLDSLYSDLSDERLLEPIRLDEQGYPSN